MKLKILDANAKFLIRLININLTVALFGFMIASLIQGFSAVETVVSIVFITFFIVPIIVGVFSILVLLKGQNSIHIESPVKQLILNIDEVNFPQKLEKLKFSGNFLFLDEEQKIELSSVSIKKLIKTKIPIETIQFEKVEHSQWETPITEIVKDLGMIG